MYVTDTATLYVKTINGRNGPFNIADLDTEVGSFKVKDPILDQFEEGTYKVRAFVESIYMGQYVAHGRGVNELRARLADLDVIDEASLPPATPPEPEPDPIDEPTAKPPEPPRKEPEPAPEPKSDRRWDKFKKKTAAADDHANDPEAAAESCFDAETLALVAAGEAVKLDPTIDRAVFRQQTAALKARGYRFDAKQQTWFAD